MKLRMSSFSAALCLSIMMVHPEAQAKPLQRDPALVGKMLTQGWTKVAEGVLQKTGESGRSETFTYGEEGTVWAARRLEARLELLEREYEAHPSDDLARVIKSLQSGLGELDQNLKDGSARSAVALPQELASCSINYGAEANAFGLSGSQAPGVGANAAAVFSASCGQLGNTYAYAYTRATAGTLTTIHSQEDPKYNGTSLSSSAAVTASGTTDCFSQAYARAWSPTLNINYEVYAPDNYSCPNPPATLYNSVSGPYDAYMDDYYSPCTFVTWTASASGGVPGYTYDWYIGNVYQGSGDTFSQSYCYANGSVTVKATAHDSAGQSTDAYFTTWLYYQQSCSSSCGCNPINLSSGPASIRPPYDCPYNNSQN